MHRECASQRSSEQISIYSSFRKALQVFLSIDVIAERVVVPRITGNSRDERDFCDAEKRSGWLLRSTFSARAEKKSFPLVSSALGRNSKQRKAIKATWIELLLSTDP